MFSCGQLAAEQARGTDFTRPEQNVLPQPRHLRTVELRSDRSIKLTGEVRYIWDRRTNDATRISYSFEVLPPFTGGATEVHGSDSQSDLQRNA